MIRKTGDCNLCHLYEQQLWSSIPNSSCVTKNNILSRHPQHNLLSSTTHYLLEPTRDIYYYQESTINNHLMTIATRYMNLVTITEFLLSNLNHVAKQDLWNFH